jgi:uncharacterized protein YbjT (DUF2867 family)
MKKVIITGSSGMIGGLVLQECLQRDDVASVTTIVRKRSGMRHRKLNEVILQDFLNYAGLEPYLSDQDICFFCIGVYTGQVPADEFKKITVDYTKAFAEALKKASPNAAFCFLSGQGADPQEKSRILFAREKGIAENALLRLKFPHTYLFRPGYIYPVTPRQEPNGFYQFMRVLYKIVSPIIPGIGVPSTKLAHKMVEVGFGLGKQTIYEHRDIRKASL